MYLESADEDIDNVIKYISNELGNKTAASKLANKIINSIGKIKIFPYGAPVLITKRKLKNIYRYTKVNNYLIFYYIDEANKTIMICRVLYHKMNVKSILY